MKYKLDTLILIIDIVIGIIISFSDDITRSNMGSTGDSEKIIQRLNDELQAAQEQANTEKHRCMELQGNK